MKGSNSKRTHEEELTVAIVDASSGAPSSSAGLVWPSFYPDQCPPAEATPAQGVVLRLVRNDPACEEDFLAWSVEHGLSTSKPCQSCGVSVFDKLDDVRRMQRRVPSQRRKAVAQGQLTPEMGVVMPTPGRERSHRTWWIPSGVEPAGAFRVVGASSFQSGEA